MARAENPVHAAPRHLQAPALTTCPECHAVRFEGRPARSAIGSRGQTRSRRRWSTPISGRSSATVCHHGAARTSRPLLPACSWPSRSKRGFKRGWGRVQVQREVRHGAIVAQCRAHPADEAVRAGFGAGRSPSPKSREAARRVMRTRSIAPAPLEGDPALSHRHRF